jgi:rRNA maturation RNase YbeY
MIEFSVEDGLAGAWDEDRVGALVRFIVEREHSGAEYTISLHLNGMRFVLPPGHPASLGDVVVSYPRALQQAKDFGHSIERELGYLVAHGVLHVLGYDHEQPAERRAMRQKEEEALAPLGFTR